MTATFEKILEYDFNDKGYPVEKGFHFDVYVNGKFFCSTKNESFAISIVKLYQRIDELYIEHIKNESEIEFFYISLLEDEEKNIIAKFLEKEKALFDFLLETEQKVLDELERQDLERQEQERQEQAQESGPEHQ